MKPPKVDDIDPVKLGDINFLIMFLDMCNRARKRANNQDPKLN